MLPHPTLVRCAAQRCAPCFAACDTNAPACGSLSYPKVIYFRPETLPRRVVADRASQNPAANLLVLLGESAGVSSIPSAPAARRTTRPQPPPWRARVLLFDSAFRTLVLSERPCAANRPQKRASVRSKELALPCPPNHRPNKPPDDHPQQASLTWPDRQPSPPIQPRWGCPRR